VQVTTESRNVTLFTIGLGMKSCGFVYFGDTGFTAVVRHAIPERTPFGHSDCPLSHGALRVRRGYGLKLLEGLFIPKRVNQGDAALERRLHGRDAGDGHVNGAKLFNYFIGVAAIGAVVMMLLCGEAGCGGEKSKDEKVNRLHDAPGVLQNSNTL
jgi:hypothetical protein